MGKVRTSRGRLQPYPGGHGGLPICSDQATNWLLTDPATSIFIAARVLSNLREREFRGIPGRRLTREQIEVLGARYNRGPSIPRRRLNLDYGQDITKRWRHLNNLLSGR
jgi:hypothetical protein